MSKKKSDWEGLDAIEKNVFKRYSASTPLHRVILFPATYDRIGVLIFYHKDQDVKTCFENGTSNKILDAIHEELDKINRGPKAGTHFDYEYDSDERVKRCFGGSYFNRLR